MASPPQVCGPSVFKHFQDPLEYQYTAAVVETAQVRIDRILLAIHTC